MKIFIKDFMKLWNEIIHSKFFYLNLFKSKLVFYLQINFLICLLKIKFVLI